MSQGEDLLALHMRSEGIKALAEYRFAAEACGGTGKGLRARLEASGLRDWRADFAILDSRLLVEVEGGGWSGGRHTRGAGFEGDLQKYDAAMRLGFTVYRCSPAMVKSGRAIQTIKILMELRKSAQSHYTHYRNASYTQATNKRQECSRMKLVEILARELKEWPENAVAIAQDADRWVGAHEGKPDFHGKSWGSSCCIELPLNNGFETELATGHATAIVTREMWEAERAKLKSPKANGDGWIRHRGGKCPVEAGTLVDVRYRSGKVNEHVKALVDSYIYGSMPAHNAVAWGHIGGVNDIMAYRIHKPAEQLDPSAHKHEQATEQQSTGPDLPGMLRKMGGPDVINWRDRIRELDIQRAEVESTYQRQISEITQERESLVQKLAGEGLALVEVVVQPAEDMSDWRNWKAGDELIYISDEYDKIYTKGKSYKVKEITSTGARVFDDGGGTSSCHICDQDSGRFKFVSRPAT